jgi:hypothetical protein
MALLSFKWFMPLLLSAFHPFYVSVTEITHNAKTQDYEISCKLFAEDLEAQLQKGAKTTIDLGASAQHVQNEKLVGAYMQQHLSFNADGKALSLHYLGFEVDKEAVFCYFEVENAAAPKKMQVQNSLLHEFNEKQINIIHVTVAGKRQSTKLDFPNKTASFTF